MLIELEYEQIVALLDDPDHALKPGPGKFEGNDDLRIARALYTLTLDGQVDDQIGSVDGGGWIGWIGRFVCMEDTQGFFGYEVFETSDEAKASFLGYGSDEDEDE